MTNEQKQISNFSDINTMAERWESLKAAMLSGSSLLLMFLLSSVLNSLLISKYIKPFNILSLDFLNWLISGAIAGFCGFLFGVTYRYIVRTDKNPQLKAGGIMAFGLVRGLSQVDMALYSTRDVLSLVVLFSQGVLSFAIAGIILDTAMRFGWVKAFGGNGE
jgi:hypothetical protein